MHPRSVLFHLFYLSLLNSSCVAYRLPKTALWNCVIKAKPADAFIAYLDGVRRRFHPVLWVEIAVVVLKKGRVIARWLVQYCTIA